MNRRTSLVKWTDGSVPSPLGAGLQVSKRPAEDDYLHRCPTQLALSPLAFQLSPLHWYMAWNGVTPI